tara:strand:- start:699 stop:809 length:111 start_codon:yes stop_codon:yes gene_type:complete
MERIEDEGREGTETAAFGVYSVPSKKDTVFGREAGV